MIMKACHGVNEKVMKDNVKKVMTPCLVIMYESVTIDNNVM